MRRAEVDTPLSGGDTPPEPPRLQSPVSLVDPFSTAQPPRLPLGKSKGRDGSPHDPSLHTNVVAISLLTSPMTSSLYTRNSSDAMLQLPTSGTPFVDAALSSDPAHALPIPSLSRDAAIAENTGLRYRGHASRSQGYGLSRSSATARRASAVTVLSSDMDGDNRAYAHNRRPRRVRTSLFPFSTALGGRHVNGMSRMADDSSSATAQSANAEGWSTLAPTTSRTCGERLRELLYPKPADVGIEGAESLIDHKMEKHNRHTQHTRQVRQEERRSGSTGGGGGGRGHGTRHRLSLANEADEGLMHIELPVAAVLEFTVQQRRTAELRSGFCWYLPVLIVVSLFVLFAAPQGPQMSLVSNLITVGLESHLQGSAETGQDILLEAVRIDTEQYSNGSHGNFVEGGSDLYPWQYTHYNATINSWTPQPNPTSAVDAQVMRVSGYYRNPNFVRIHAVRTKRDVMRWLRRVFMTHLWDCQSPTYERPWTAVLHGSSRLVGAARLTTRRRATRLTQSNSSYACKRTSLAGLNISCQAGSGTEQHTSVGPPSVPVSICNRTNPARTDETLFRYQNDRSGYVAQLPFSASCANVMSTLNLMATRKEDILWPPYSHDYAHMTDLWSEYEMDTNDVESCNSFFFHRSVTELEVEYVVYSGAQNTFFYARTVFSFAATGSVVVPTVRVHSAPALAWDTHFAQLGISIVVVLVVILYAAHCIAQFTADYKRKLRLGGVALAVDKDSGLRGLASAVQRFLRLWPIVGFVALALSVAAVAAFWASLGRDRNRMVLTYAARNDFPSEIAKLCVETSPVYRRLGVAALFFVYMYLLRFASAMLGPWATMEAIQACATRIFTVCTAWFFITIGVAICGQLLFGSVLHEFSSFGRSYMTLTLLFVDRCRFMFTQSTFDSHRNRPDPARVVSTSSTEFDATLPSVRGSNLAVDDPTPIDTKRHLFEGSNSPGLYVFLLFIIYVQFFLFFTVLMAILMEAFRQATVALHISRMPWSLTLRHARRALSLNYAKESIRRLLWGRRPALLFDDVTRYVSLTDAAMRSTSVKGIPGTRLRTSAGGQGGKGVHVLQSHLDSGAHISYAGVLWRFPREFQAEFGAMHLRQWWLMCVDSVRFLHHNDSSWLDERLAAYYDGQQSGLKGWLKAGIPSLPTLEARVFSVDAALEELPHKIVRFVELEMQEAPPLRSADTKW